MHVESSTSLVRLMQSGLNQGPCTCKYICQQAGGSRKVDVSNLESPGKQARGKSGCRPSMHPASVAHLHIISLEMSPRSEAKGLSQAAVTVTKLGRMDLAQLPRPMNLPS